MSGQTSNEALSSPAKIIARKGSSVWLHWNYTSPIAITFDWQTAGYINSVTDKTIEILARQDGSSGQFKALSVIPAPFTGRVDTISHNNTLVIKNLQYNDTSYKFSSFVKVSIIGVAIIAIQMKPVIEITVQGTLLKFIIPLVCCSVIENIYTV